MTIVLFLIDTSGSMNQRTHNGARSTLLDITKETVEKFIKIRQHSPVSRGDRYMLLTFDEVPYNVKAGWKENHAVFINELKNLTAVGMTTFGCALKNAFDYLNINRMQTGIDTYGQGRCPYYLEAAIIVAITDGAKYTTTNNVQHELNLPMNTHSPGAEFTLEPFRWDQRLFSIVLRLTGTYNVDTPNNNNVANNNYLVPCDDSPINAMCEVTGGRSFCVTSQKSLNASVEQLLSRMHIGVMIRFEKFGPDPPMIITNDEDSSDSSKSNNSFDPNNRSWTNCRNLIYVRSGQKGYSFGNWPIPEAYCPDLVNPNLQPRTAHPIVKFTCSNSEPAVINNLPFDKYELDPSPLTQYILSRKQPNVAWQVYISNSQRNSEFGHPFGYLKASTNLTCVNLFVLPYNYPALLPLLDELIKLHQGKPTREWRQQFDNYLKGMPIYYSITLRRAIQRMTSNANHGLVPDSLDVYTTVTLNNLIKKHKNMAKLEFDKMAASVGSQRHLNIEWPRITNSHLFSNLHHNRKSNIVDFYCSNPQLKRIFACSQNDHQDFNGFIVRYRDKPISDSKTLCYRNPFDIERHELIDQLNKLRYNFFQKRTSLFKYQDEDQLHNLPVSQMGNYQEYVKRFPPPLREIEATPTRQHMFGNPFKLDKKNVMVIDEADFEIANGGSGNSVRGSKRPTSPADVLGSKPKRKPGPLPKDFPYFRLSPRSPQPTPPPSPNPYSAINNTSPFAHENSLYSHSSNSSPFQVPMNVINKAPQPNGNFYSYVKPNHTNIGANNHDSSSISQISSNKLPHINYGLNANQYSVCANMNLNLASNSTNVAPSISKSSMNTNTINNNNPPAITNGTFPANKSVKLSTPNQTKQNGIPSNYSLIWINLFRRKNFTNDEYGKKRHVMKLVRRPGQDHSELLQYLSSIDGQFGDYLLHEVVLEASRFKRKSLICSLSNCFGSKVEKILQLNKE